MRNTKFILVLTVFLTVCSGIAGAEWISPGQLTKSHSKIEGLTNCVKCHELGKGILDSKCLSCHEKLVERIKDTKGFHATVKGKCIECHTDHKGGDYNIMQFDTENFDHIKTGYELKDKHKVECNKCHRKERTYLGLSVECLGCHTDVHKKALSEDCLKCHSFKGWKDVTFEHDKYSEFKLTGKHIQVKCESCHEPYSVEGGGKIAETGGVYKVLKFKPLRHEKCSDCHYDIHKGQLKEKACDSCHSTEGWEKKTFEHNAPKLSDFNLQGKHEKVSCGLCHPEEKIIYKQDGQTVERLARRLKPVKHDLCSDCHYDVHQGQLKDTRCDVCHKVENEWKKNVFKHESEQYKGFRLEGKHKEAECDKCHVRSEIKFTEFGREKKASPGKLKPLKSELCNDCHYDVHQGQLKDTRCDVCHKVENEWKKNVFKHESEQYKGFRLEGKHREAECDKCHVRSEIKFTEFGKEKKASPGRLKPLKSELCSDCHYDVHQGQFRDKNCVACHTVKEKWADHTFKHDSKEYTGYRLEGKHNNVLCEKCHLRSEIKFSEFGKEKKASPGKFKPLDYQTCTACHEDIHKGKFEKDCEKCHAPESWEPKKYLHDPLSFEMKGAHKTLNCTECHKQPQGFKGLDSECISCHKDQHLNQFGPFCTDCHKQDAWIPFNFRHTGTGFRLVGGHRAADCSDCHINRDYRNTPSECFDCHQSDYQSAPMHISAGYSHDCTECHKVTGTWSEAAFRHTSFTFRGAHAALTNDCTECHGASGSVPPGTTDNDCYVCHSASGPASTKYETVASPSHTTFSFSTTCTECHTVNAWTPANYAHQAFQLTGVHATFECASCHSTGYPGQYAGVSANDCYACHEADFQSAPDHVDFGFDHDCTTCHSGNTWEL